MVDFSVIVQSPQVRAVVQEGFLEREFKDALVPRQLFRGEVVAQEWPANVGDSMIFSGEGLMSPDLTPIRPGQDVSVGSYSVEQWEAQINQRGKALDVDMPTSAVALANLFMRNAKKLGEQSAITLNRAVRNKLYNAAESGWTVVDTTAGAANTIRVARLSGFTRARRPEVVGASPVRFNLISASNPLPITILNAALAEVTRNAIAFTPDVAGDELGSGTLTFDGAAVAVTARVSYVFSYDRASIVRVGGGNSIEAIGPTDLPTLVDLRSAAARMRNMNVPTHPDGRYHAHLTPDSEGKLYANEEFQRLNTGLPEYIYYREFAIKEILGMMLYRNPECPQPSTVVGAMSSAAFPGEADPFAPELYVGGVTTGLQVSRIIVTGMDAVKEYWQSPDVLISDAGLNGKVGPAKVTTSGVEMLTDRIQMIFRAPIDRLQQKVGIAWSFIGDWVARTDSATGDNARFKRTVAILHG